MSPHRLILIALLVFAARTADAGTRYAGPWGYPTVQAAVDAAQPGDTVWLYPQTWYESVRITKSIVLAKHPSFSGTPQIVGTSGGALVLDLHNAEPVSIQNLALWGKAGPVIKGPNWITIGRAPKVDLQNVAIGNGTVGISGFANLTLRSVSVRDIAGPGIAVYGGVDAYNTVVERTTGRGIWIYTFNTGTIANRIRFTLVKNTGDDGIFIDGARNGSFWIDGVTVEQATGVGLALQGADGAQVDNAYIEGTREKYDAKTKTWGYGDGIDVIDAEGVDITRAFLVENARVGLAAFGDRARAWVEDTTILSNPIDLDVELGGSIEDLGGNTCWEDPETWRLCHSVSSSLAPPSLPPPPARP